MDLTLHTTFLPHTDPEESLRFYRDTLGFTVLNDVAFGGNRWITVAPAAGADGARPTCLVLEPPAMDPGLTDHERRTIGEMMAKGTYARLILATPDLDAVFEKVAASGAEVIQEPTDQPYGVRDCAFRDPAGNHIRINQA